MGNLQLGLNMNKKWSGKKNPTGNAEFTDWKGQKWVGNFTNGQINGSFSMFDKDGVLILQGRAIMDSITEATQFVSTQFVTWTDEKKTGVTAQNVPVPVYSGTWKNQKWYVGRWFSDIWSEYNMKPRTMKYIDATFGEDGYPEGEVEVLIALRQSPDSFYLFYKGGLQKGQYDGMGSYYLKDGTMYKTGASVKGISVGTWRGYPPIGNKENILYLEAHRNFYFRYNEGTERLEVTGWLHTQYIDGHCTKTFYDNYNKQVQGFRHVLPSNNSGIRPDSMNYETIYWNGHLFSGTVVNGKPNGWGKLFTNTGRTFVEGLFKDGVSIGPSAELGYSNTDVPEYVAIYNDGKPVPGFNVFDPVGEELKKNAAEAKKRADEYAKIANEPVNLLRRGDVIKLGGKKYTVVSDPWDEKGLFKNYRGWVELTDDMILRVGTPFEKTGERNSVITKTCTRCGGRGIVDVYKTIKVLLRGGNYSTYQQYTGANTMPREVTVALSDPVYETKLIPHGTSTCPVCNGEGKILYK